MVKCDFTIRCAIRLGSRVQVVNAGDSDRSPPGLGILRLARRHVDLGSPRASTGDLVDPYRSARVRAGPGRSAPIRGVTRRGNANRGRLRGRVVAELPSANRIAHSKFREQFALAPNAGVRARVDAISGWAKEPSRTPAWGQMENWASPRPCSIAIGTRVFVPAAISPDDALRSRLPGAHDVA